MPDKLAMLGVVRRMRSLVTGKGGRDTTLICSNSCKMPRTTLQVRLRSTPTPLDLVSLSVQEAVLEDALGPEMNFKLSSWSMSCAGKPLSKWLVGHPLGKAQDVAESRAVFVVSSCRNKALFLCLQHCPPSTGGSSSKWRQQYRGHFLCTRP